MIRNKPIVLRLLVTATTIFGAALVAAGTASAGANPPESAPMEFACEDGTRDSVTSDFPFPGGPFGSPQDQAGPASAHRPPFPPPFPMLPPPRFHRPDISPFMPGFGPMFFYPYTGSAG